MLRSGWILQIVSGMNIRSFVENELFLFSIAESPYKRHHASPSSL